METKKRSYRVVWLILVLVVVAAIAVAVVIGVRISLTPESKSAESKSDETRTCTESMMSAIEQQCLNASPVMPVIPECAMKLRKELSSRLPPSLGMNVTEDVNDCSPEHLALLSVALYTSNQDSPTFLSNRLGLTLLFYATNGRGWLKGSDWVSSKPHCDWEGVSCNEHGNVKGLVMEVFKIQGSLPSRIVSLLSDLKSFSVEGNQLTGTLPSELSELQELSVSANSLTGTLAGEFFESTSLQSLDVSRNKHLAVNAIPFVGTQWKNLLFTGTTVNGGFLSSVSVLSNLVTLYLQDTSLDGTVPTEIGKLTSLTDLQIHENMLLGGVIPTELQNLTKLQSLTLEKCTFSGTIPSQIGNLSELQTLDLGDNDLTGGMPTELGHLTKLRRLLFHDNKLEGTIPSEVCELRINGILESLGALGSILAEEASYLSCPHGGLVCPIDTQPGCCN